MILIAHRGNIAGVTNHENKPDYVKYALGKGYDAEVDVWYHRGQFYLGHDEPRYETNGRWLKKNHLWCHAKSIEALYQLTLINAHCFFQQADDVALTSWGYLWTYTGAPLTPLSIAVLCMPDSHCAGVCLDDLRGL